MIESILLELHLKTGLIPRILDETPLTPSLFLRFRTAVKRNYIACSDRLVRSSYPRLHTYDQNRDIVKTLARRHQGAGDLSAAEEILKWAMGKLPTEAGLRNYLVDFYVETDQWDKAESVVSADLTELMLFYTRTKQVEKAERIATTDPLQRHLFTLYVSIWQYHKAADVLLHLSTHSPTVLSEFISFCTSKGLYLFAETALKSLQKPLQLLQFYLTTKQFSKAELLLKQSWQPDTEEELYQHLTTLYTATHRVTQTCEVMQLTLNSLRNKAPTGYQTLTAARKFLNYAENQRKYSKCEAIFRSQLDIFRKLAVNFEIAISWQKEMVEFYKKTKQFRKAEVELREIMGNFPENLWAVKTLAEIYACEGFKNPEKEEDLRLKLRNLQENDVESHFQLSDFYSRWDINNTSAAEKVLLSLISHKKQENSSSWELFSALNRLEDFYRKKMMDNQAESVLNEILSLRQSADPASDLTLSALIRLKDFYMRPATLNPEQLLHIMERIYTIRRTKQPYSLLTAAAGVNLAETCERFGARERGEEVVKEVIETWKDRKEVDSESVAVVKEVKAYYGKQGREKQGKETVLDMVLAAEQWETAGNLLIQLYAEAGTQPNYDFILSKTRNIDEQLKTWEEIILYSPQNPHFNPKTALIAIKNLEQSRNPHSESTLKAIFRLIQHSEKNEQISLLEQALEIRKKQEFCGNLYVETVEKLTDLYVRSDKLENAIEVLNLACREVNLEEQISDNYVKIVNLLSITHFNSGNTEKSLEILRELVEKAKKSAIFSNVTLNSLRKLGDLYEKSGKFSESESQLQEICDLEHRKDCFSCLYLESLGNLTDFYKRQKADGKCEEVMSLLVKLHTKREPESAAACDWRGKLVNLLGNKQPETAETLLIDCFRSLPCNKPPGKLIHELVTLSRNQGWSEKRRYWLEVGLANSQDRNLLSELYQVSTGSHREEIGVRLVRTTLQLGSSASLRSLYK